MLMLGDGRIDDTAFEHRFRNRVAHRRDPFWDLIRSESGWGLAQGFTDATGAQGEIWLIIGSSLLEDVSLQLRTASRCAPDWIPGCEE